MLGELIGEVSGKDTGRRVLAAADGHAVLEVSFEGTGGYYGVTVSGFGTYETELRADGTVFGDGQGVDMTADGQTVTWHGSGLGHLTDGGVVQYRGAIFFSTTAPQLEKLNGVVGVFEFDAAPDGTSTGRIYEWK
ncbi:hypothetical protein [Streptomyces sp. NRRL WC-3742]|uniref:hypothetical protein n=1 Tax=Streptomyces sp. NRRL WC-3742 TaxID=1463934 RepID=UPI0004C746A2|nr:hypothetical protein [Streptomyces sp. NRRL WC-3742]